MLYLSFADYPDYLWPSTCTNPLQLSVFYLFSDKSSDKEFVLRDNCCLDNDSSRDFGGKKLLHVPTGQYPRFG